MSELQPSRFRRLLALLLVIAYAAVIYGASAKKAPSSITDLEIPDFFLHMAEYGGLGFLLARWLWLIRKRLDPVHFLLLPTLIATLYGITDEIHQSFVPDRDATAVDVLADTAGSLLGAMAYRMFLAGLMWRAAAVPLVLVVLSTVVAGAENAVDRAAGTIRKQDLKATVNLLASPELRGRDTPSPDLNRAARYLAARFESYGLEPGAAGGGWFQELPVTFRVDEGASFVRILSSGGTRTFDGENVAFDRGSPDAKAGGPVMFAGYGIVSGKWNDYAGLDPKGKVVVLFEDTPARVDRKHILARDRTAWARSSLRAKAQFARSRGAVAVLAVRSPKHGVVDRLRLMDGTTREGKVEETPKGYRISIPVNRREYVSLAELDRLILDDGREIAPGDAIADRIPITVRRELREFRRDEVAWHEKSVTPLPPPPRRRGLLRDGKRPDGSVPVVTISSVTAEALLARKLVDLADRAVAGVAGFDVKDQAVVVGVITTVETETARNVIARCPGRARKNEAVILTAHYDHVGVGRSGEIYHGADDNASGTAVLLAVGKAFASLETAPARPVFFVAFAGEEKGFLGSGPFVTSPPIPLDSMLACINMDMVGRGAADEIGLMVGPFGTNLAEAFKKHEEASRIRPNYEILKPVDGKLPPLTGREKVSMKVPKSRYFGRSDQVMFYRKGIPAAFLFGGTHADYHRPSDTTEKLVLERMERVGRFIFRTTHGLAETGLTR